MSVSIARTSDGEDVSESLSECRIYAGVLQRCSALHIHRNVARLGIFSCSKVRPTYFIDHE